MTKLLSFLGVLALGLSAGTVSIFAQTTVAPATDQPVVNTSGTPSATDQQKASQMVAHARPSDRSLAPHDTFYMLTYVAVKTGTGVEGFTPGQEVHLVEVHRPTHTLVVTDGHAQVEVPPSSLTNDIEMGTTARQNDQANQTKIAGYMQREKEAYDKYERSVADATQKDLEGREQQQQAAQAEQVKEENTPVAATATPSNTVINSDASIDSNGYYGDGGYGYGNPYSYFVNVGASPTTAKAPTTSAAAPAPNNVAAPTGGQGGHAAGGHGK